MINEFDVLHFLVLVTEGQQKQQRPTTPEAGLPEGCVEGV